MLSLEIVVKNGAIVTSFFLFCIWTVANISNAVIFGEYMILLIVMYVHTLFFHLTEIHKSVFGGGPLSFESCQIVQPNSMEIELK